MSMYDFCGKYLFNKKNKPTCKTLLKAIDLAREAERLCRDVEKSYVIGMNREIGYVKSQSYVSIGLLGGFRFRRGPCVLERRLRNNYKGIKLLVKDCNTCKKLSTCNILDYVKQDTLKT